MQTSNAPERTCVVCRRKGGGDNLLRLGFVGGEVVPQRVGKGRGAYVCVSRRCLTDLAPGMLSRAYKSSVKDMSKVVPTAHALAERRVLDTVGLARRCGALETGIDRVLDGGEGVTLVAGDLADRSSRRAQRVGAHVFLNSERLGRATGMGSVGAMRIQPGRLANDAAYWLAVWNETSGQLEVA